MLAFVSAYNFAKLLKAIRWKTPFEALCHAWTTTPEIFKLNPRHLTPGPYTVDEVFRCISHRIVPKQDLALFGFNGLDIGQALPVPLSTIRSNRFLIGQAAVLTILQAAERPAARIVIDNWVRHP